MRVTDDREFFMKAFPQMMQATRILIVDHDITRYHSFDLLRYTLFTREDLFVTMKPQYRMLLNGRTELAEQVRFMQNSVDTFNIYKMFEKDDGVETMPEYTKRVRDMIQSEHAKITSTDVSSRFDVVFDRSDITGFLLQYEGEKHKPSFYDKLTVYEVENPLDLDVLEELIRTHRINAVMVSSSEVVIRLVLNLIKHKHKSPITFIVGRYAYNFHVEDGKCVYPLFNRELGIGEVVCKHEFGFFDPFSGLTYKYRLLNAAKLEEVSES